MRFLRGRTGPKSRGVRYGRRGVKRPSASTRSAACRSSIAVNGTGSRRRQNCGNATCRLLPISLKPGPYRMLALSTAI
jgi:hypothetical protein